MSPETYTEIRRRLADAQEWTDLHSATEEFRRVIDDERRWEWGRPPMFRPWSSPAQTMPDLEPLPHPLGDDRHAAELEEFFRDRGFWVESHSLPAPENACAVSIRKVLGHMGDQVGHALVRASDEPCPFTRRRLALVLAAWEALQGGALATEERPAVALEVDRG